MYDFFPYSAVFLDLDGTIYHDQDPLPGAVELVARLDAAGIKFACLTNSNDSPRESHLRLARMGIQIPADHIYTATAAAADYVFHHLASTRRPRVFNLASEGLQELLEGMVDWVEPAVQPCDAVLAGAPSSFYATPDRQWIALQLLRNGAKLVGMCADRVFPSPRGVEFGSGALNTMLAYAANVKPIFCGKPERIFLDELCTRLAVDPRQCILIGDNLESDIAGAKAVGMATILTLSGITRRADLEHLAPEKTPDKVIKDLTELL